jgi:hypothetical protein
MRGFGMRDAGYGIRDAGYDATDLAAHSCHAEERGTLEDIALSVADFL